MTVMVMTKYTDNVNIILTGHHTLVKLFIITFIQLGSVLKSLVSTAINDSFRHTVIW